MKSKNKTWGRKRNKSVSRWLGCSKKHWPSSVKTSSNRRSNSRLAVASARPTRITRVANRFTKRIPWQQWWLIIQMSASAITTTQSSLSTITTPMITSSSKARIKVPWRPILNACSNTASTPTASKRRISCRRWRSSIYLLKTTLTRRYSGTLGTTWVTATTSTR